MAMKRQFAKKLLGGLLALTLAVGLLPVTASAEQKYSEVYIGLSEWKGVSMEGDYRVIYSTWNEGSEEKVEGASYNASTNTLTLNNVKSNDTLIISGGAGMTIQLVGQNELGAISIYAESGNTCPVILTGTGSLTVNTKDLKESEYDSYSYGNEVTPSILVQSYNGGNVTFKVDKTVTLTLNAKSGGSVVSVKGTTAAKDQAIRFETKPTTAYSVTGKQAEQTTTKAVDSYLYVDQLEPAEVQFSKKVGDDLYLANYTSEYKAVFSNSLGGYVLTNSSKLDSYPQDKEYVQLEEEPRAYHTYSYFEIVYKNSSNKEVIPRSKYVDDQLVYEACEFVDSDVPGVFFAKGNGQTYTQQEWYSLLAAVVTTKLPGAYDYEIKASSLVIDPAAQTDTKTDTDTETKVPEVGTKEADQTGAASYKVTTTKNGNVEVSYVETKKKSAKTVKVPDTVTLADGTKAKVTSIEKNAFKNAKVTTVTVGNNVKTIGSGAFQGAKNLKNVTIGKNVETIGSNAFKNCTKLTKVTVKGSKVKSIGASAFQGAKKLKAVSVGKSVTTIGKNAFNGCTNLKTITITSTKIKSFGKGAFKGISSKATIKVPKKQYSKYKKLLKSAGVSSKVKIKKS